MNTEAYRQIIGAPVRDRLDFFPGNGQSHRRPGRQCRDGLLGLWTVLPAVGHRHQFIRRSQLTADTLDREIEVAAIADHFFECDKSSTTKATHSGDLWDPILTAAHAWSASHRALSAALGGP